TGTVKDRTGSPLIGVSVVLKGLKTGTTTDINGVFSINLPANGATLVFTYIGMADQEITVTKPGRIDVVLDDKANSLNEVVVVGYGSQRRGNVTGSISTVNTKELV